MSWMQRLRAIEALEDGDFDPILVAEMEDLAAGVQPHSREPAVPRAIRFSTPTFKEYSTSEMKGCGKNSFPAFSVTAGACALDCDHCQAKILEPMIPATSPEILDRKVRDLILRPVEGILTYHPLVIQRIRAVTAGHPYFIQYICDELLKLARKQETNYVELTDLEYVIRNVLQDAAGNIENSIFRYLGADEKLVLATLAHVTDEIRVFVPLGDIVGLLERRRFSLPREAVVRALGALEERDLINEMRIGQQLRYAFAMGLTRMWLRQNDILLKLAEGKQA